MNINEIIRTLMKENKVTQSSMAASIGKKRATDVSARLASKNMTFDSAIEMLTVMGYEVVVQKRTAGTRRKDQIVVERSVGL
jgi:hypothetical protein